MKLIKILSKTVFMLIAILYAACLVNGVTVIEYSASEDGGTLSVAGRTIEVSGGIADAVLKAYSEAESQAAELLPAKVKKAVEQISDLLDGG